MNDRLEKLNAYLISKGKPPKQLHQNFIKCNAKVVKQTPLKKLPIKDNWKAKTDPAKALTSKNNENNQTISKFKKSGTGMSKENKLPSQCMAKHCKVTKHKSQLSSDVINKASKNSLKCNPSNLKNSALLKETRVSKASYASMTTKKLLRRSMNTSMHLLEKKNSVTVANKNTPLRKSSKNLASTPHITGKSSTTKQLKLSAKKTKLSGSLKKIPTLKKSNSDDQRNERLVQLRQWMISKGKDPSRLTGFKPAKIMLTPVHSPVKNNSPNTSQWPSLRDEDYYDELSVLVKGTMNEAMSCLEKNCSVADVHSQLMVFREKVVQAEQHSCYWTTLAAVYEKLGKDENEILSLYEEAIRKQAKPANDIKQALRDFVDSKLKEDPDVDSPDLPHKAATVQISGFSVLEKPSPPKQPSRLEKIPKSEDFSTPGESPKPNSQPSAVQNTTVLNFSSHNFHPLSPLVTGSSSVVKLRMVQKSSPIFKKLASRKALPFSVSAIVTPVRRSKRIEEANWKYPKELLSHDPCVQTPLDLVKPEQNNEASSKDFVFDRNAAFGDDYSDIRTILKF